MIGKVECFVRAYAKAIAGAIGALAIQLAPRAHVSLGSGATKDAIATAVVVLLVYFVPNADCGPS